MLSDGTELVLGLDEKESSNDIRSGLSVCALMPIFLARTFLSSVLPLMLVSGPKIAREYLRR